MELEPLSTRAASHNDRHYNILSTFAKTAIATAAMAGFVTLGVFYTSGHPWFASAAGDDVSASEQASRIEAFKALGVLRVAQVPAEDTQAALDSMHLSPDEQAVLRGELAHTPTSAALSAPHADVTPASGAVQNTDTTVAHAVVRTQPETPPQIARPAVAPAPAKQTAQTLLVWVRLWDTDVEDGDVVRIDSAGYSRTVTLTKNGVTFAVPVAPGGHIRIAGIRDGDGGGITVGLASGSTQAILPIMSVGQVLNLNVRAD